MVLSGLVARAQALAQQLGACVDYSTRWGDETSKISAWVRSSRFKLLVKKERESGSTWRRVRRGVQPEKSRSPKFR